jgi:hypothetical protein
VRIKIPFNERPDGDGAFGPTCLIWTPVSIPDYFAVAGWRARGFERFRDFMDRFRVTGWRRWLVVEPLSVLATLGTGGLLLALVLAVPALRETASEAWLKKSELSVVFLDRFGNEIGSRGIKHKAPSRRSRGRQRDGERITAAAWRPSVPATTAAFPHLAICASCDAGLLSRLWTAELSAPALVHRFAARSTFERPSTSVSDPDAAEGPTAGVGVLALGRCKSGADEGH